MKSAIVSGIFINILVHMLFLIQKSSKNFLYVLDTFKVQTNRKFKLIEVPEIMGLCSEETKTFYVQQKIHLE